MRQVETAHGAETARNSTTLSKICRRVDVCQLSAICSYTDFGLVLDKHGITCYYDDFTVLYQYMFLPARLLIDKPFTFTFFLVESLIRVMY